MNKAFRQGQILNIIRRRSIYTQEELAGELKKVGVPATQVTLSRDIRDLGLVKTGDGYRQMRTEPTGPDLATIAAEFLQDVRLAQNLIVLKTPPAHASTMAAAVDGENWSEVLGTLAGDDTVLMITADVETARVLYERLMKFLG